MPPTGQTTCAPCVDGYYAAAQGEAAAGGGRACRPWRALQRQARALTVHALCPAVGALQVAPPAPSAPTPRWPRSTARPASSRPPSSARWWAPACGPTSTTAAASSTRAPPARRGASPAQRTATATRCCLTFARGSATTPRLSSAEPSRPADIPDQTTLMLQRLPHVERHSCRTAHSPRPPARPAAAACRAQPGRLSRRLAEAALAAATQYPPAPCFAPLFPLLAP